MIWEGEPSAATVERLRELGVQSAIYAPCANRPSSGDLLSVMRDNGVALQSVGSLE